MPFVRFPLYCLCAVASALGFVVFFASTRPLLAAETDKTEIAELAKPFLRGPAQGLEEIVFAVRQRGIDGHWYANFSYYANSEVCDSFRTTYQKNDKLVTYREGGRLCRLHLASGNVTTLLDDPQGGVRDPVVSYDADKILFSYRPGSSEHYHLYEIGVDGSGLHQLTDGPFDDIEPCYLPDGDIVFVSSRCKRWVNCWVTQVAVLHRCDADGQHIRAISANLEQDNTPWVLPDGRILYQRWEYVDRSQVDYHHLWTTNPDGTAQMVYYGNLHPGTVMIDAKPIPRSDKVVAIFSPGHGRNEHDGFVTVLDAGQGPDDQTQAKTISLAPRFRDPWAFSESAFMAVRPRQTRVAGRVRSHANDLSLPKSDTAKGLECHEPRPLLRRSRTHCARPHRPRPRYGYAGTDGHLPWA